MTPSLKSRRNASPLLFLFLSSSSTPSFKGTLLSRPTLERLKLSDHTPLYFASTRTPKRAGVGKVLKRKKGKAVRTTRGAKQSKKGARSFAGVLDEAMLDRVPPEVPTYASAAAAPPRAAAPRKFCSVCGFQSCYNCARCGMRFCSRKCNAVHTETRCLKFTA
jgi:hypothetical protein